MLYNVILVLHVIIAVALVAMVLLQQGKGADAGAAFGSGSSGTVFGSRGAANFLTRSTGVLAILFFASSLTLFTLASDVTTTESVVEKVEQQQQPKPVKPEPAEQTGAPADVPLAE